MISGKNRGYTFLHSIPKIKPFYFPEVTYEMNNGEKVKKLKQSPHK